MSKCRSFTRYSQWARRVCFGHIPLYHKIIPALQGNQYNVCGPQKNIVTSPEMHTAIAVKEKRLGVQEKGVFFGLLTSLTKHGIALEIVDIFHASFSSISLGSRTKYILPTIDHRSFSIFDM